MEGNDVPPSAAASQEIGAVALLPIFSSAPLFSRAPRQLCARTSSLIMMPLGLIERIQRSEEVPMFLTLAIILAVIWLVLWLALHIASGLIHILIGLAVILFIVHLFRGKPAAA